MGKLQDKVAIITGSGAGIGQAIAFAYAEEGAKIVIADFNEQALNDTVATLTAKGVEAIGVKVNIAIEEDVAKMIDTTVDKFGTVDILVNNAGIMDNMQAAENVEDAVFERVMSINVGGVMRTTRKVLPLFKEKQAGVIINMASVAGITGGRGGFAYTASKHAVVGMTKNVASQYGPQNIRCNAIAPAFIPTALSTSQDNIDAFGLEIASRGTSIMPRPGATEEIAKVALFLASDDASYVSGQVIAADFGWSAY